MVIRLSSKRLDRLSEFFANISLLFFASLITPLFTHNVINLFMLIIGTSLTLSFLFISLIIIKS